MIRLGTRGSKLALAQSNLVAEQLRTLGAEIDIVVITTTGDRAASAPPDSNATGIFVKELEAELLRSGIDLAVHSLKDMPTDVPEGLALGAILTRGAPLDTLVCRDSCSDISALPAGASVGTSSPRRCAQLLHYRPDLEMRPIRGNVDTRLRKLDAGEFDAVVLAQAGLERLGIRGRPASVIPSDICLPAPGQGALAVEVRCDDEDVAKAVGALDDANTRACVTAERAFLKALGGGCRAAVGALAKVVDDALVLEAMVAAPDGSRLLRTTACGEPDAAETVGRAAAGELAERGADELIRAAR
jgi:hydroxymethylbilane synthase